MFGMRCEAFRRNYKKFRMAVQMSSDMNYEEAVKTLNSLQSNKVALEQVVKDIQTGKKGSHLIEMERYLQRTGVSLDKLDELSVIHVAGTKGKGSTSAMCESILRHHGFKTGFYSSPHLVVVRERIRLNGNIIDKEMFSQYFSEIFYKLNSTKAHEGDMPKYFHFLTVMALNVFLKEKVDVAILETGIGGAEDSTNVVRNTSVAGITALGLDHTSLLGNTIELIARAKAGIMKPRCDVYTVYQPADAMAVLSRVASEMECPLHLVPDYVTYNFPMSNIPELPTHNEAYCTNASLAIQLAHAWLRKNNKDNQMNDFSGQNGADGQMNADDITRSDNKNMICSTVKNDYLNSPSNGGCIFNIPMETVTGLTKCSWPGRYQILKLDFADFYIDGAHTKESLEICSKWFTELSGEGRKILIFSATGDRNSETLLQCLASIEFESVFFVVPVPYKEIDERSDTYSIQEYSNSLLRCEKHVQHWRQIKKDYNQKVIVHECILDVCNQINQEFRGIPNPPSVLVTGSLYLVGGALAILDPNFEISSSSA